MKLYYFAHPNFGDALNPFLWLNLLPNVFDEDASTLFIGTGTLLNDGVPRQARKVVFGTGAGYGSDLPKIDDRWTIYWVRGPLTARALGLDESSAISDGAMLLNTLDLPPVTQKGGTAFMPHWQSTSFWDWEKVCSSLGLTYIDPRGAVQDVLLTIRSSSLLITEALHGAIVADAFRVPWVAVRAYRSVLESKWQDWCRSLDMVYEPVRVPPLYSARSIVTKVRGTKNGAATLTRLAGLPVSVGNAFMLARVKQQFRAIQVTPPSRLSEEKTMRRAIERMQAQLARFQRQGAVT